MSEMRKGCIGADGKPWVLPCEYTNDPPTGGSRFGWRTHPYGGYKHHNGVDLSGYHNMPIYATKAGKITVATYNSSAGNYMILDHGDGTKSVYMHMGQAFGSYPDKNQAAERDSYSWRVEVGQEVEQGDHIGDMGSTGCSTGTHLHFGIQKVGHNDPDSGVYVDPMAYIGGPRIDISAIGSYVKESSRIINTELATPTEWSPKYLFSGSSEGSSRMSMIKRGAIIGNLTHTLFNSNINKCDLLDGYGVFGLNSNLVAIPDVSKEKAMDVYRIKNEDGSYKYKKGELSGEDEKIIASYIYSKLISLTENPWSHNSIIALLANIKSESGLNPARWESDIDWSGQPGISRGFGLIQWTPWDKFYNKLPEGYDDPYDIDAQIQGIINYQNNSYFIHTSSTYNEDIENSTIYATNDKFREYFNENRRFNINKTNFREGKITTNISLSEMDKINILTVAYCYNAERPAHCNATTRTNYASHFVKIFGEINSNAYLFKPSYEEEDFWSIAVNDCKYESKDNFSYCISRANEIIKHFLGDDATKFIVNVDDKNWFDKTLSEHTFEHGNLPRVGSIMCWKHVSKDEYRYAIVERVIGTHWLEISEYDSESDAKVLKNELKKISHNWDIGSEYSFIGFIYTIPEVNITADQDSETEETENKKLNSSYLEIDEDGNLLIQVINKTNEDKYTTVVFAMSNMKHINRFTLYYKAFIENAFKNESSEQYDGNELQICLAQQVWNCKTIGSLDASTFVDSESDYETDNGEFLSNWPFTYFPYKQSKEDANGKIIPNTNPNLYHGPYPAGNLTLGKIKILENRDNANDEVMSFNAFSYIEKDKIYDCYNNSGDINRLLRNHPGYLCITVKTPSLEDEDVKEGKINKTTVVIKQILANG